LYADDFAADLRADLRECFGDGLGSVEAVDKLMAEYASSLTDSDEEPVFWLVVADTGWKLGRLDDRARQRALEIIDDGRALARWPRGPERRKREKVLATLHNQLVGPPPIAKRVPRNVRSATEWGTGEVIGFRLASGRWTLIRVLGHHEDKGGRSAVCELLDWIGVSIPLAEEVERLPVRHGSGPRGVSQFLFQEPRTKRDKLRIVRTDILSTPSQSSGGYSIFVWPYVDRQFAEVFGLA